MCTFFEMNPESNYDIYSVEGIVSDKKKFEDFVYTPLDVAIKELKRRREDSELDILIKKHGFQETPGAVKGKMKAVLFRQLSTPNYETRRFLSLVHLTEELDPLMWEFYDDKFTSNNEWKHSLGKVKFFFGMGKKGGSKIDNVNVIEFNESVGKPIKDVKTVWGQRLVDFHHELFYKTYKGINKDAFFDASGWFRNNGVSASGYYSPFLSLFVRDAILFENFTLNNKELSFTKDVFLPAFIEVYRKTGCKPLIVALEPTELEDEQFWMCHPSESKKFVDYKLRKTHLSGVYNYAHLKRVVMSWFKV